MTKSAAKRLIARLRMARLWRVASRPRSHSGRAVGDKASARLRAGAHSAIPSVRLAGWPRSAATLLAFVRRQRQNAIRNLSGWGLATGAAPWRRAVWQNLRRTCAQRRFEIRHEIDRRGEM